MASCCPPAAGPGVSHDYSPKGKFEKVNDLELYVAGSGSEKAVVLVYDIFGYTQEAKQVLQVADILAQETGATVVVPDFFRAEPWPLSKMPPGPGDDLMGWIMSQNWAKIKPDFDAAVEYVKAKGAKKTAALGFCWGVSITLTAAATGELVAAGGAHPSLFGQDKALAEGVKCPVILLPSKDDNVDVAQATLSAGPYASKCVFHKFNDQGHGFLAARGDWDKPEVAADASKALGLFAAFLNANFAA